MLKLNTFKHILFVIFLIGLMSCGQNPKTSMDEIRESQGKMLANVHSHVTKGYESVADSAIVGYWFEPHAACFHNITFYKDKRFEYKCSKDKQGDVPTIRGTYLVKGDTIVLSTDYGWDGTPVNGIMLHKWNGTNEFLTNQEDCMYLVKGNRL